MCAEVPRLPPSPLKTTHLPGSPVAPLPTKGVISPPPPRETHTSQPRHPPPLRPPPHSPPPRPGPTQNYSSEV